MNTTMIHSFISLCFLLMSCTAEDEKPKTSIPLPPEYASCCGATDTTIYRLGDAWIAVPNVFTPNGDGKNDLFYPVRSSEDIEVSIFTIYDTLYHPNPDVNGNVLIQSLQGGISYDFLDQYAWKGFKRGVNGVPEMHKGRFKYRIGFYYKGPGALVNGQACLIQCGEDAKGISDLDGCIFQTQINSQVLPDSSLPHQESSCLGG